MAIMLGSSTWRRRSWDSNSDVVERLTETPDIVSVNSVVI